jgi:hypothetical protein
MGSIPIPSSFFNRRRTGWQTKACRGLEEYRVNKFEFIILIFICSLMISLNVKKLLLSIPPEFGSLTHALIKNLEKNLVKELGFYCKLDGVGLILQPPTDTLFFDLIC